MIKTFCKTDIGKKRNINQDYVFTSVNSVGNLPNLFIVADGMGGHKAGGLASVYAVENIVTYISKETVIKSPISIMEKAITFVNELILEKANENCELKGMGTTLVMSSIIDKRLYIANVGDSRLYIINNSIRQITNDHSLVEEMVKRGEIMKKDAILHPDRNIITKALGIMHNVQVDYFEYALSSGDIILMCTDGLSNMLNNFEIFEIVSKGRDAVEVVDNLINLANKNGGNDNIGIVIIEA